MSIVLSYLKNFLNIAHAESIFHLSSSVKNIPRSFLNPDYPIVAIISTQPMASSEWNLFFLHIFGWISSRVSEKHTNGRIRSDHFPEYVASV